MSGELAPSSGSSRRELEGQFASPQEQEVSSAQSFTSSVSSYKGDVSVGEFALRFHIPQLTGGPKPTSKPSYIRQLSHLLYDEIPNLQPLIIGASEAADASSLLDWELELLDLLDAHPLDYVHMRARVMEAAVFCPMVGWRLTFLDVRKLCGLKKEVAIIFFKKLQDMELFDPKNHRRLRKVCEDHYRRYLITD